MITILTQDRKNIINAERIERIFVLGKAIYAHIPEERDISIGEYTTSESILKVMNYVAFSLAGAKDIGKTIVIPSEDAIRNDREIAEKFIKAMKEKKAKSQESAGRIGLSPELVKILEELERGDSE